jgi:hypothetical protein
MHRRHFLQAGTFAAFAAPAAAVAATVPTRVSETKAPSFRLGLVTYNLAAAWNLATLLRVCKSAGISPVELRTTHKHGVEPSLTKEQRKEVRKRFADAGIDIWGCGTTCEFHSPILPKSKRTLRPASASSIW